MEEKLEEKKDFSIICAVSKAGETLSKYMYFANKAERLLLLSSMIEQNIKTLEVKNVLKAFSVAESNQKIKL